MAQPCFAQKTVEQFLEDPTLTQLYIEAAQINLLTLQAVKSKRLSASALLDGEYSSQQMLSFVRKGATLYVAPAFTANFELPNDKLGVHKVFSIELDMTIPDYLEVIVKGDHAEVSAQGSFKKLQINLNTGFCFLENVGREVRVVTQAAPIFLRQYSGIVTAFSTYGTVSAEQIPKGLSQINVRSHSAAIKVVRNQSQTIVE